MHPQTFEMIAVAVAAIAFITWRQSQWQSVSMNKLLRMPVIFALLGLFSLVTGLQQVGSLHLTGLDLAIVGGELVLGLAAGVLMGRFTQIDRIGGVIKSRLTGAGIAVWIGFLVVRIGMGVLAHISGAQLAAQTGTILIVVAVIKAVQVAMIRERVASHERAAVQESYVDVVR